MKTLCVLFVLSFFIRSADAEMKIPAAVFRIAQFEDAAKQAVAQKKALAIVNSAEHADANGTIEGTAEAFKELTGWTVIVFVEAEQKKAETFLLPPPLATALTGDGPHYVPHVLICPASADEVWASASIQKNQKPKDFRKGIKEVEAGAKVKLAAYFKDKTPPPLVMPGDKQLSWGIATGGSYSGKFVKLEQEKLYIAGPDGKVSGGIELKTLAPATQRYARLIAGAAGSAKAESKPAAPAAAPAAALENWQNKDGKVIRAAFVALKDEKVTLRLESGKEYTLPVESLSLLSQSRARELAR